MGYVYSLIIDFHARTFLYFSFVLLDVSFKDMVGLLRQDVFLIK